MSGRTNALALKGKKVSFEKVIGMIDDMVVLLGKEQQDSQPLPDNISVLLIPF